MHSNGTSRPIRKHSLTIPSDSTTKHYSQGADAWAYYAQVVVREPLARVLLLVQVLVSLPWTFFSTISILLPCHWNGNDHRCSHQCPSTCKELGCRRHNNGTTYKRYYISLRKGLIKTFLQVESNFLIQSSYQITILLMWIGAKRIPRT